VGFLNLFLFFRAHFNYEEPEKGELSFKKSEVFHVVDTLHNGVVGSWQVFRMGELKKKIKFQEVAIRMLFLDPISASPNRGPDQVQVCSLRKFQFLCGLPNKYV